MKTEALDKYALVLITFRFPFGSGESFIENEKDYLFNAFRKTIIISQDQKGKLRANIPDKIKIYRYNTSTSLGGFLILPSLILGNLKTLIRLWHDEIGFRKESGFSLTSAKLLFLTRKIIKALQLKYFIGKVLDKEGIKDKVLLYSYWLGTGAHASALFDSPGFVKIARAHGSDLYEEKSSPGFLPLLHYCSMHLDSLFFVSEDGQNYFSTKYKGTLARLVVSKLGVRTGQLKISLKDENKRFVIVSCSNIIPLKRLDLIINSLAIVSGFRNLLWIHYGDGYLKDEILDLASDKLDDKNNIEYEFRGQVPNDRIMKFYSENRVDLIINASLTEGLPVSIMEAQLHGIPAIATDVGGVREVVTAETGKLVPADITPAGFASAIEEFMILSPEEYERLRESCRNHCQTNFNADTNYTDFINKVNSILASRH